MLHSTSPDLRLLDVKESKLLCRIQKILLPFLLLVLGNLYIYNSIIHKQYPSFFYQNEFAPAVMFACGYEFANPKDITSSLRSFLENKTTTFDCSNIVQEKTMPLNHFQDMEHYMILSAGVIWRIMGVGWDNLIPLFLILYSISLLETYFIFRLGMNPYLSFLSSLCVALSSMQTYYVIQLRDYSVAPFLLGILCIAGKLLITSPGKKKLFFSSCGAGALLGLGLGFRVDLLVMLPFFLITLLFFVKVDKNAFQNKFIACIAFLTSLFIAGFPILYTIHHHSGGNLAHVIILGLADSFTSGLGLGQPETYSVIPAYRDLIPYTAVNSFSQRAYGVEQLIPTSTKEYNYYSSLFLLNYLSTFPADFLIRIYASIFQVPLIFVHGFLQKIANYIPLRNIVVMLPFVATAIMAFFQLRLALFVLFAFIYLGAYPVLQFDARHYFYLEFVGLWFIGFLSQQFILLIKNKYNVAFFKEIKFNVRSRWKLISIVSVVGFTILSIPVIVLRIHQTNHLKKLFNSYLDAKAETINPVLDKKEKQFIIKLPIKNNDPKTTYLATTYLRIKTTEKCPLNQISIRPHYLEEPPAYWEPPKILTIATAQTTTFILPIYNFHNGTGRDILDEQFLPSYWIDSLAYSIEDSRCIQDIAYLKETRNLPLLLTLKLHSGWENTTLYQSFQRI